jgi:glyoxylase I family protein
MRSTGVHHVDLVVSDVERSLVFYRELLGPLGWHGVSHQTGERGETIHYLFGPGSSVGLRQAPGEPSGLPVDRYRVGLHHLCLEVQEQADLARAAQLLRRLGATITDGPRHFPEYRDGYHALFFEDPDGLKLELVWTLEGTYDYQRLRSDKGQEGLGDTAVAPPGRALKPSRRPPSHASAPNLTHEGALRPCLRTTIAPGNEAGLGGLS